MNEMNGLMRFVLLKLKVSSNYSPVVKMAEFLGSRKNLISTIVPPGEAKPLDGVLFPVQPSGAAWAGSRDESGG